MSQVTIYLEDDTLEAAKRAATRDGLSLSRWFAQFAEAERAKAGQADLRAAMSEIDRLHGTAGREDFDFLLDPKTRYAGLGDDAPRESME